MNRERVARVRKTGSKWAGAKSKRTSEKDQDDENKDQDIILVKRNGQDRRTDFHELISEEKFW